LWWIKFAAIYARRLKQKHRGYGDTFYIDEVFVKINGRQHYCGDQSVKMARWWMGTFRHDVTVQPQSGVSED